LGINVDESLSPSLLEKVSYLGTLLHSFPAGETAIRKLLEMTLGRKRIERLTERIGSERVLEREGEIELFKNLTLTEKLAGPAGVEVPEAAVVMDDGGRFQKTTRNEDSKTHWHEFKAGFCAALKGRPDGLPAGEDALDPIPEVPEFLRNLDQVESLTREIGKKAADVPEADEVTPDNLAKVDPISLDDLSGVEHLQKLLASTESARDEPSSKQKQKQRLSPEVQHRDVVATSKNSDAFGEQLAARTWSLGLFQAQRKACVGDGGSWLWTIWERWFKPFGFVPILDIIHAVTYLYAAAMAGRPRKEGGPVYCRWVAWVWQGDVAKVIAELAQRQQELGLPTNDESDTSPRKIVDRALTYLQNQKSRMDYPRYRKLGLPITSSLMESTVKQLNRRIKGTEKFWSDEGGEAMLQMKADTLSDSDPLANYWTRHQNRQTGLHRCCGKRNAAA
jgi:hypothetical protein